jgi:iron complex outermembrane receptor protein
VEDDALTPRFGLLWRPRPALSLYGSYTENFGASSGFGAAGRPLPPETAQQWELGAKTSLFKGRLTGSLALFDLTKQNVARPDPANPRLSIATGEVRHRGMELDLSGEISPGCNLIGSYAYLDSEITKDSGPVLDQAGNVIGVNAGNQGNRLAGTPRHNASLWTTCELQRGRLRGLRFGAGVYTRSQNFADPANNALRLPGYATINLMLGYERQIGPSTVSFQFNLDNLLDKAYFDSLSATGANYATPRTFLGLVRVEF